MLVSDALSYVFVACLMGIVFGFSLWLSFAIPDAIQMLYRNRRYLRRK